MNKVGYTETGQAADKNVRVLRVSVAMKEAGLSSDFITHVVKMALRYEGIANLMLLWEELPEERDSIVAALDEETADEHGEDPPLRKPKIDFSEIGQVTSEIKEFKDRLRDKVDKWGGISKLASETGIPQPSLSRFFNGSSMPRRTTLYKIANALDLSETEIRTPWIR